MNLNQEQSPDSKNHKKHSDVTFKLLSYFTKIRSKSPEHIITILKARIRSIITC